ncbi:hypothetical protein H9L39_07607 [Fusarium oxysporum f. sp. albedinis]|nr:hypothetical protein H9L39_07607 [Fusarium oxysporum f. sp. albedinis]
MTRIYSTISVKCPAGQGASLLQALTSTRNSLRGYALNRPRFDSSPVLSGSERARAVARGRCFTDGFARNKTGQECTAKETPPVAIDAMPKSGFIATFGFPAQENHLRTFHVSVTRQTLDSITFSLLQPTSSKLQQTAHTDAASMHEHTPRLMTFTQNMYARCWMFAQRTSDGPIPIGSSYLCCPRYTRIETFGTKDRYHDVHHIRRRRSDSNFAAVYSNDAYAKLLLAFLLCPFDRLLLHVFAFVRSQITARTSHLRNEKLIFMRDRSLTGRLKIRGAVSPSHPHTGQPRYAFYQLQSTVHVFDMFGVGLEESTFHDVPTLTG